MKRETLLAALMIIAITLAVVAQTPKDRQRNMGHGRPLDSSTNGSTNSVRAAAPSAAPCAPHEDRVGFPAGFRDNYTLLYTYDREPNKHVFFVYGNDKAASAQPGQPLPYGSILALDGYFAQVDEQGEPVLDEHGRFLPDYLDGIAVMRKEVGFGEDYCQDRAGEWEFVQYKEDGSYITRPEESGGCAQCHQLAGAVQLTRAVADYVYRMNLYHARASGGLANAVMQNTRFLPTAIESQPGSTVTWYNDDVERHHIVSDDGTSFDSVNDIQPGSSFSFTINQPGEYSYHCSVHPRMKHGKVIVKAKSD